MRVLTAPKADTLSIEAGSANVRIVVEELRKNVEVTLDASGPRSEEAADKASLVGNKLTVPTIAGITFASHGSVVNNSITGGTFFGGVVMSGGTLRNNRFRGGNISAGNVTERLTVTVRIPKGISVTGRTSGGSIATSGKLTDADLRTDGGNITASGPLTNPRLNTGGGNIDVDEVEGTTALDSGGGNVVINKTSGVLNAMTSGGTFTAERITGVAVLNSSGGNIYAHADHPTKLSADTSGGNFTISGRYDRNTVTVRASGGNVYYR